MENLEKVARDLEEKLGINFLERFILMDKIGIDFVVEKEKNVYEVSYSYSDFLLYIYFLKGKLMSEE